MESSQTSKVEKFLNSQIRFRDAAQADVAFIFHSWLKSHRHAAGIFDVPNPVYFAQHHLLVEGLAKSCSFKIACNASDASQIFGYLAFETIEGSPVVHYCYVKEPYRKLGLAKFLLESAGINPEQPFFYTHRTKTIKLIERKYPMVFNPYLAYPAYAVGRALKTEQIAEKWAPNPKSEAKHRDAIMTQVNAVKAIAEQPNE